MRKSVIEQRIAVLLAILGIPVTYFRHRLSLQALRDNAWDTLLPWIFLLCLFFAWHVLRAAFKVYRDEQQSHESSIVLTDLHRQSRAIIPPVKFRLSLYGSTLLLLALPILFSYLVWSRATGESTVPPPQPITALAMQCDIDYLPIVVIPHSEVAILLLNDKPEMVTQHNSEDRIFHWPSRELAIIPKDDPHIISKCVVADLNQPLEDISIPLDIVAGKSNKRITTTIQFPLLGSQPVGFYIVNQCPATGSVVLPNTAKAKLLGEETMREIPLRGAPANSLGKIVFGTMFPSHAKWASNPVCD